MFNCTVGEIHFTRAFLFQHTIAHDHKRNVDADVTAPKNNLNDLSQTDRDGMFMLFERIDKEMKLNKGLPKNNQGSSRPIEQSARALDQKHETNKLVKTNIARI